MFFSMVKIGWSGVRFLQEYRQNPNFQLIGAAYDCNLRAYLAKNDYQEGIESDADVYNTGMKIYTGRPFYRMIKHSLYRQRYQVPHTIDYCNCNFPCSLLKITCA